jgi:hypothetical protein
MTETKRFILTDEYSGEELICNRAKMAEQYIEGNGIEIGALHKPLAVSLDKSFVKYVDYKTYEENRQRYPELVNEDIVHTDIIDDGFILKSVDDTSVDFIIANHALEHSPDPYGTLLTWGKKLRKHGIIYVGVPIAELCYDKGREITSLDHLQRDHELFKSIRKEEIIEVTKEHIREFIEISDRNIRVMNSMEPADEQSKNTLCTQLIAGLKKEFLYAKGYEDLISAHVAKINRIYDIHYHTFTPTSYEDFLQYFCDVNHYKLESVAKNGSGECIGIIRKS